ncbi:hypothetical protein HNQ09_003245 [Deinococcus budaensis]|uniref:Uncharacterized protein n=1 Tax=Deinococcus budaensis TaxID=1665626 RepID=A0A7W8GI69_9DEIO|nr:hypothetical protein [Deinococcus budaensis]
MRALCLFPALLVAASALAQPPAVPEELTPRW